MTPELSLEWAKSAGGSEKQLLDVAGIVEVTPDLDLEYVDRWAKDLDVVDLWRSFDPGRRA
jgi:hypothetical protein